MRVKQEPVDVKPVIPPLAPVERKPEPAPVPQIKVDPAVLEAQRQERQRAEEDRMILAELPDSKLSFIGAWEAEARLFSL